MLETQYGAFWTMLGPEMARTCPCGAPLVQDFDFGTNIVKATLIIIKKWMLEAQSTTSQTTYGTRYGQKRPKHGHLNHSHTQIDSFITMA